MNREISKDELLSISIKLLCILLFIVLLIFGCLAFTITSNISNEYRVDIEASVFSLDNIIFNAIGIVFFIIISMLYIRITKRMSMSSILRIALCIIFSAGLLWVLIFGSDIPIRADQEILLNIAKKFHNENFSDLGQNSYIGFFPYQLGFVYLLEGLVALFGDFSALAIRLVNVIAITFTTLYIYKITNKLFHNEEANKVVLFLTILFIPIILTTTFVYGNVIGLAFGIAAIYYILVWLDDRSYKNALLLVITISIAIVLKSNFKVYMVGIVLILVLELFRKFDKKILLIIPCTILLSSIIQTGMVIITENRGERELASGIPMVSFIYMGFSEGTDGRNAGWYNAYHSTIYFKNKMNAEDTKNETMALIIYRIKRMFEVKNETVSFFTRKIVSTWCEPTYQSIWINQPLDRYEKVREKIDNNHILISIYNGKLNEFIKRYLDIFQICVYLISAIYLIRNRSKINISMIVLGIIFIGGVIFHLIWETKSLYVIMYFVLLFPYVAKQLSEITFGSIKEK